MSKVNENLRSYFLGLSANERVEYAQKCQTTVGFITQIYLGNSPCNPTLAIELDKHSGGLVKCDELSPVTDFDYLRQQVSVA